MTNRTLVVDLDGTLLKSDMLYESFWSAFARDWKAPFLAARALPRGKAVLKQHLGAASAIDETSLPYDERVLDYIRHWRDTGGRTALVTATTQSIADRIASHLGLFDEVHGSDGNRNLKGTTKANFLVERFGDGHFDYMGDHAADVAVWERAGKAIVVQPTPRLSEEVRAKGHEVEYLATDAPRAKVYFRQMRPHQWLKNLLVFLPKLAAHDFRPATIFAALLMFVSFSLIASSV